VELTVYPQDFGMVRELRSVHGDKWEEKAREGMNERRGPKLSLEDAQVKLSAMRRQWNAVFSRTLGQAQRSLVSELREVRNRWAHQELANSVFLDMLLGHNRFVTQLEQIWYPRHEVRQRRYQ